MSLGRAMRNDPQYHYRMQRKILSGYDLMASEYYSERHMTSRNFDRATLNFLRGRDFPFLSSGLVLDLGCGRGSAGRFLNLAPSRIIHADRSQEMLLLPHREPSLLRTVCDAAHLPFADQSFQGVCAFLFDPYCGPELFPAIARVLKPGGAFFGTLPAKTWGDAIRQVRG